MLLFAALLTMAGLSSALDNGLARTPPMGWLAWERSLHPNKKSQIIFFQNFDFNLCMTGFGATRTAKTTRTTASANGCSCRWPT